MDNATLLRRLTKQVLFSYRFSGQVSPQDFSMFLSDRHKKSIAMDSMNQVTAQKAFGKSKPPEVK